MDVVVIVNGREAIPVRAVPWVTGWSVSPDVLVNELARCEYGPPPRLPGAVAYGLADTSPLPPKQWDFYISALKAVQKQLDAEGASDEVRYLAWRQRATTALPSGVFLWKDELERAFARGYGCRFRWAIGDERDGDRGLTLCPMIPDTLTEHLLEGFERLTEGGATTFGPSEDAALSADPSQDDASTDEHPNWEDDPTLTKLEKQRHAIQKAIKKKKFDKMAIPDGEKGTLKELCREKYPQFFKAESSFETAWKSGREKDHWRMQSHASYAKRGKD